MKINRLFVLLTFLAVSCGAQASQGLKIETQIERVGLIQYLPINMNITLINEGPEPISLPGKETEGVPAYYFDNLRFEVQGRQDLSCFNEVTATLVPPHPFPMFSIPPGGKHTFQVEIAERAGLMHPGTYQVRVIWDSSKIYKGWKGYAESEWVTVIIEEAKGPDMGLINAAKAAYPQANWQCLLLDGSIPMELLEKYPTSIYMGNKLASGGRGFREAVIKNLNWLIDYFNNPNRDPKLIGKIDINAHERMEAILRYLPERPDFFMADWMRLQVLYWKSREGDFASVKSMADLIEKTNTDKESIGLAKNLIVSMKKAGILKN